MSVGQGWAVWAAESQGGGGRSLYQACPLPAEGCSAVEKVQGCRSWRRGLDPGLFASAVRSEQALGGEDGVPRIRMGVRRVTLLLRASSSAGAPHTVLSQLISCLLSFRAARYGPMDFTMEKCNRRRKSSSFSRLVSAQGPALSRADPDEAHLALTFDLVLSNESVEMITLMNLSRCVSNCLWRKGSYHTTSVCTNLGTIKQEIHQG